MAERDPQIDVENATPTDSPLVPTLAPSLATGTPEKASRNWRRIALMGIVPLLVVGGGLFYWQSLEGKVSTDNAYVQQDKVAVSAEVGGQIVTVAVREGQQVKAGDLLLTGLSMNYVPVLIPFSSFLLLLLNRSKKLTPTLEQMNPASDFIKTLNKSDDPGIP